MSGFWLAWFFLSQPVQAADELVDVQKVDGTIRVALLYSTVDNEAKRAIYPARECWVKRPVAEALARVQAVLHLRSSSLLLRDCYRPASLHTSAVAPLKRETKVSTRHSRGLSVDVSLVDEAGVEVGMPEVSARKKKKSELQRAKKRTLFLKQTMEKEGFVADGGSPWHYDFQGWEKAANLDVPTF